MRLQQATEPEFDNWEGTSLWPVRWIGPDEKIDGSYVVAYRKTFDLSEAQKLRVHVSADQRYRLFVNGVLEGEGPTRGDEQNWFYETYDLDLDAGDQSIVAIVWTLDPVDGIMPAAQITIRHGFLLAADNPFTSILSTGQAAWEYKVLDGISFVENGMEGAGSLSGSVVQIDGSGYPWDIEKGLGKGWKSCREGTYGRTVISNYIWGSADDHFLTPTTLAPPVSNRHAFTNLRMAGTWPADSFNPVFKVDSACRLPELDYLRAAFSSKQPVTIKANQQQWLLFDLGNYYCGYPEIHTENGAGARIRILWAESLCEDDPGNSRKQRFGKGNRNAIDGKFFFGKGDTFLVGSTGRPQHFTSFWWSCGRYVAIQVQTGSHELTILEAGFRETRYPQEFVARIDLSNEPFKQSKDIMWRTLQMCAHETYMDCPYYEQINYAGDSRLQALTSYVVSGDFRLARKCIQHFSNSFLPNGLTQSRTPCSFRQVIPQFSLFWICMVFDYARWHGDQEFVRHQLPGIRHVIETFLQHVAQDGLLRCPDGWDWVDWVPEWEQANGNVNPRGTDGSSAVNHLQLVYTLGIVEDLERWVGSSVFADHYRAQADILWKNGCLAYWEDPRGLFAATVDRDSYNVHTQCFAALCRQCEPERLSSLRMSLLNPQADLVQATFYFQFYLFCAYAQLGLSCKILEHLPHWQQMADSGCKTTLEKPDPSRSDCHAWAAHPLYHAIASIGGIQPVGFGFRKVRITPAVDCLDAGDIRIPSPFGEISLHWQAHAKITNLAITIPASIEAELQLNGTCTPLRCGTNQFEIPLEANSLSGSQRPLPVFLQV